MKKMMGPRETRSDQGIADLDLASMDNNVLCQDPICKSAMKTLQSLVPVLKALLRDEEWSDDIREALLTRCIIKDNWDDEVNAKRAQLKQEKDKEKKQALLKEIAKLKERTGVYVDENTRKLFSVLEKSNNVFCNFVCDKRVQEEDYKQPKDMDAWYNAMLRIARTGPVVGRQAYGSANQDVLCELYKSRLMCAQTLCTASRFL